MIGLVKALSGLIKAFPKLADILEDALFYFRNAQAESHRIDKDSSVDAFINKHIAPLIEHEAELLWKNKKFREGTGLSMNVQLYRQQKVKQMI